MDAFRVVCAPRLLAPEPYPPTIAVMAPGFAVVLWAEDDQPYRSAVDDIVSALTSSILCPRWW